MGGIADLGTALAYIAALEQQLAECQRKAAALDWLEAVEDVVVCKSILAEKWTMNDYCGHVGHGATLTEAIESLRKQVEQT